MKNDFDDFKITPKHVYFFEFLIIKLLKRKVSLVSI